MPTKIWSPRAIASLLVSRAGFRVEPLAGRPREGDDSPRPPSFHHLVRRDQTSWTALRPAPAARAVALRAASAASATVVPASWTLPTAHPAAAAAAASPPKYPATPPTRLPAAAPNGAPTPPHAAPAAPPPAAPSSIPAQAPLQPPTI